MRGNHDRACTGQEDLEWFNPVARAAALWTLENLSVGERRLRPRTAQGPADRWRFQVVHGSPFDEDEYLVAADQAAEAFNYLESRLAFFGHTHVQGGFIWNQSRVETIPCGSAAQRPPVAGYRPRRRLPV